MSEAASKYTAKYDEAMRRLIGERLAVIAGRGHALREFHPKAPGAPGAAAARAAQAAKPTSKAPVVIMPALKLKQRFSRSE